MLADSYARGGGIKMADRSMPRIHVEDGFSLESWLDTRRLTISGMLGCN